MGTYVLQYLDHAESFGKLSAARERLDELISIEMDSSAPADDGAIYIGRKVGAEVALLAWNINVSRSICHESDCKCGAGIHPDDDDYCDERDELAGIVIEESDDYNEND